MWCRSIAQTNKRSFPSLARRSEKRLPSHPGLEIILKDDISKRVMGFTLDDHYEKDCFTVEEVAKQVECI